MIEKIKALIEQHCLLEHGDRVIVALSGGADSVTLLYVLYSLKELYNIEIQAAHLNHGIRGEEADRDERFVRRLCADLGVELHVRALDIPAMARERGESLELCGREARYAFFADLSERYDAKIATAHTLSDHAETVLLHLIRGAGLNGLSGIPVKRDKIIRPLLSCSREEVEAYCAEHDLQYVTDSTNLDDVYTRNKLRLQIIPALKELNPALEEGLAHTACVAREAEEYLNKISLEELNNSKTAYGYSCEKLLWLDPAVLHSALKQLFTAEKAPVDHRHIELVIAAMQEGGAVDLGRGRCAVCAQGILRITDGTKCADGGFCVPFERAAEVLPQIEKKPFSAFLDESGKVHKKFLYQLIPCAIITDDTVVRTRCEGDAFTDARRGVTKTLKKLFNELKIPRERRDSLRLIADGSTVLWIEGIGTAKQAQIPDGYDGEVYVMTVNG